MAVLDRPDPAELTMRDVAKLAQISERTVYRYFASRLDLAQAVIPRAEERLARLPLPSTVQALLDYPNQLFPVFDENRSLIRSLIRTEFGREVMKGERGRRLANVERLLAGLAPHAPRAEVVAVATSVRLLLSGTSWFFHRFECGLDVEQTVARVSHSVRVQIDSLRPPKRGSSTRR